MQRELSKYELDQIEQIAEGILQSVRREMSDTLYCLSTPLREDETLFMTVSVSVHVTRKELMP